MNYGFRVISREGAGRGYISLRKQREPLDQTNLRNDVDASYEAVGGIFWKLTGGAHCQGPSDTRVGPGGPTW